MKYTIRKMMFVTALVALAIAPSAYLGIRLGILATFLAISTFLTCVRLIDLINGDTTKLAVTIMAACAIFPLDFYFMLYIAGKIANGQITA